MDSTKQKITKWSQESRRMQTYTARRHLSKLTGMAKCKIQAISGGVSMRSN